MNLQVHVQVKDLNLASVHLVKENGTAIILQ